MKQYPDEELIAEAEKITGKPVKYILLTHAHCDHVTGFHTLRRNDISLIARKSTIKNLRVEGYPVPDVYKEVTEDIVLELDGFHRGYDSTTKIYVFSQLQNNYNKNV